jgi:probable DNA metabolism protein
VDPLDILLASQTDLAGFHSEATRLLALQVAPNGVGWHTRPSAENGQCDVDTLVPRGRTRAARAVVPQSFVHMVELVVLHRDETRFDLLYRALWRMVHEPELRHDHEDPDLVLIARMAQSVRREVNKVVSRLEFRPLVLKGRPVDFAWYEPAHHVCEAVATRIAKERPLATWLLLSPERALLWEGGRLLSAPPLEAAVTPLASAPDAAWVRVLEGRAWV